MSSMVAPVPTRQSFWSRLSSGDKIQLLILLVAFGGAVAGGVWAVVTRFDAAAGQITALQTSVRTLEDKLEQQRQRLDEEVRQDRSRAALITACASMAHQASVLSNRDDAVSMNRLLGQRVEMGCNRL